MIYLRKSEFMFLIEGQQNKSDSTRDFIGWNILTGTSGGEQFARLSQNAKNSD